MKYGFYLSPCGKYIIELVPDSTWRHGTRVIGKANAAWIDDLCTISNEDLPMFFSCWIYLGE